MSNPISCQARLDALANALETLALNEDSIYMLLGFEANQLNAAMNHLRAAAKRTSDFEPGREVQAFMDEAVVEAKLILFPST